MQALRSALGRIWAPTQACRAAGVSAPAAAGWWRWQATAAAAAAPEAAHSMGPMALVMFVPSAICGCMAYWQFERMRWKEALIQQRAAMLTTDPVDVFTLDEPAEYEKVKASGLFVEDSSLFVGPRPRSIPGFGIMSGYFMVTPLYDPTRNGVVLVNRGWVPASWREEHLQAEQARLQASAQAPPPTSKASTAPSKAPPPPPVQVQEVIGLIQPDEQPNAFMPDNKPETDEFHSMKREGLASALGLPPDTPLIMRVSEDASTVQQRERKSPLQESRSAPSDAAPPDFPIPKNIKDLVTFTTMPGDHLNYAGIWVSLCVILAFMARHAVTKPLRSVRMVDGMSRERWQADQQRHV